MLCIEVFLEFEKLFVLGAIDQSRGILFLKFDYVFKYANEEQMSENLEPSS